MPSLNHLFKKLLRCWGNWYTEIGNQRHDSTEKQLLLMLKGWQYIFIGRYENIEIMRSILYIIAVILIIGWLLGVFYWSATGLIHILIVLAVISLLLAIIRRA